MTITALYRPPFGFMPVVRKVRPGETLAEMRARMPGLPDDFDRRGTICVNGRPVARHLWHGLRPKAPAVREVTFHCPPMGGDDDGKSIFALVASIALTVVTGAIVGGRFATAGGLFAKGSTSALLLAGGVSLAGSLLLSALVPPPTFDDGARRIETPGAASATGNVLDPNGPVPRVVGTMKVFPPLAAEPLTYFEGADEVVEAVYCLAGPHALSDIRIGGAPITSMPDIEYELREGWPGDARLTLMGRQARTEGVQSELRGHTVAESDGQTLDAGSGDISAALPQAKIVATRDAPDEVQLQLVLPQGLHRNASETDRLRVPLRLRMRQIGAASWINLPELHFQAASIRQMRATVRLIWTDDASTTPGAAQTEGWVEARRFVPGQTAAPATTGYSAHSYFTLSAGETHMSAANLGTTTVNHVILDRYEAKLYLDAAVFPRGRYEIEIQRGAAFPAAIYSPAGYVFSGVNWDTFGYQGTPGQIVMSRDGVADTLYLGRVVSLWNTHPVPTDDYALVALRARNRALDAVSVVAAGYVEDWDGTGWRNWTTTDNPAPHLRDIWTGRMNLDPVPAAMMDDAGLVAWRSACTAAGYRCNAILEGKTVDEAARIVASCGYARPYMSEVFGVTRDYDRSAEGPVQIFTPRNSRGFQWSKAFARVPDGFRVNFRDAAREYDYRQITVHRDGVSDDRGLVEQVTYDGLTTEAEVRARATYDQRQPRYRGTFYSLDAPAEAIVCRRGDLVGVQHDMLTDQSGAARIADFAEITGGVGEIRLDDEVEVLTRAPFLSVAAVASERRFLDIGARTGCAIRRANGTVTVHPVANGSGATDLLTFSPAIPAAGIEGGALVTVGRLGSEVARLIVFAMRPARDFEVNMTFVDEAQELWA